MLFNLSSAFGSPGHDSIYTGEMNHPLFYKYKNYVPIAYTWKYYKKINYQLLYKYKNYESISYTWKYWSYL